MNRTLLLATAVGALTACSSTTKPAQPAQPEQPAESATKAVDAFDTSSIDNNVSPCDDFFQYACGGWIAKNPIPGDQSRWGRFDELAERNRQTLRDILEESAAHPQDGTRKIGEYYASCMDQKAIDAKGLEPLHPLLDEINALNGTGGLPELLARLHERGVEAFFDFGAEADMKDATHFLAGTDQGGLGLPERDYYLREDAKSKELRSEYEQHIAKVLGLAGAPAEQAAAQAKQVVALETELAKVSLDMVSRRNPNLLYHKMSVAELQKLSPAFAWQRYFDGMKAAPKFEQINVAVPDFVRGMNELITKTPLDVLKVYLRWQTIHAFAPFLPRAFDEATFDFYGKKLAGVKEQRPRWKRCVQYTDGALGEALGKVYVEKTFGAEGKKRTLAMVKAIEAALGRDIDSLTWMTPETKAQAHIKLAAIANKIGYPDKWRDYSALRIEQNDALGDEMRAIEFEVNRRLRRIGQPVDPMEWGMTPPTVNAYFNPLQNNINFPAGILQPPFFTVTGDDAVNFGGIGAVIGHELTHGFDDQGRQFDAKGNLRDWWTPADGKAFDERASCLVKEYGNFTAVDDVKLNGKLTLGENVADNGGLRIALMALHATLAGKQVPAIDGFTPEQRLFLGWAQVWCQQITPEAARMRAQTDPHSPGRYRVNGVVSNMPEFQKAFSCPAGAPMVRTEQCRVW